MTIVEAIKQSLTVEGKPLSYKEIYKKIIELNLYSFGAKNPEGLVRNKIRKHCLDLDFPSASPAKHFIIASQNGKTIKYFLNDNTQKSIKQKKTQPQISDEKLPEEKIQEAYFEHRDSVKQLLLEEILKADPGFFERLVVRLLLSMGYGGDFSDSGRVKGGPGDEGIDGVIKEDKLGLDKIYIQAKRYSDKKVGRPELQQFVGAMENVQKGVFITSSNFQDTAIKYAEKQQKSLVLINGDMLCDLMLNHGVGISTVKEYSTFKIDTDYFKDN